MSDRELVESRIKGATIASEYFEGRVKHRVESTIAPRRSRGMGPWKDSPEEAWAAVAKSIIERDAHKSIQKLTNIDQDRAP